MLWRQPKHSVHHVAAVVCHVAVVCAMWHHLDVFKNAGVLQRQQPPLLLRLVGCSQHRHHCSRARLQLWGTPWAHCQQGLQ